MPLEITDTIAALASAPGPADRGIVRVSGPRTASLLTGHFFCARGTDWSRSRRPARFDGTVAVRSIDDRLPAQMLFWPTRRSYTGEPMAEIHTVGAPPLLDAVLAQLYESGIRPARAGEFTLRAFLSGRVDLVQAEAIPAVIDASDQQQLERALRQLAGGVSGRLRQTRAELLAILGDLEAGLDFVEEDIEFIPANVLRDRLSEAIDRLGGLAGTAVARMESSGHLPVVLSGLPNAGKSTLFNALAESELAIVSEVPGTTRDYLVADIDCRGVSVRLVDTAGQESTGSQIMQLAQQHRGEQLAESRLTVWCSSADATQSEQDKDRALRQQLESTSTRYLHVITKCELVSSTPNGLPAVSAVTGQGLERLRSEIAESLTDSQTTELVGSTGARCRTWLAGALDALRRAREAVVCGHGDEITAIELRAALDNLGRIVGAVYTDDILDHIFSNFCIGK